MKVLVPVDLQIPAAWFEVTVLCHSKVARIVTSLAKITVINTVKFIGVYSWDILWGKEWAGPSMLCGSSCHKERIVDNS